MDRPPPVLSHAGSPLRGEIADEPGTGWQRTLPRGWAEHRRTFVAHDPTDDLAHGFDDGRLRWTWPQYPGPMAAHGYEGQFVVVPDRELTVAYPGTTDAADRRHLVVHLDALIAAVPVSA